MQRAVLKKTEFCPLFFFLVLARFILVDSSKWNPSGHLNSSWVSGMPREKKIDNLLNNVWCTELCTWKTLTPPFVRYIYIYTYTSAAFCSYIIASWTADSYTFSLHAWRNIEQLWAANLRLCNEQCLQAFLVIWTFDSLIYHLKLCVSFGPSRDFFLF